MIRKRHRRGRPAARLAALADRIAKHPYVPMIRERAGQYARLMRLDRPVGIFLLLWPTLWALWIAGAGRPDPGVVVVFVLGVVLMRSAGCVINDYADRGFDPHVARHPIQDTGKRPTASLDRNLAYFGLVKILYGYFIDGVVPTTGGDNTTPSQLMAAATVDIPVMPFESLSTMPR